MPYLPWKLSCTDRMAMSKAKWDMRSSSATLLEHGEVLCTSAENRIFPLIQFVGSFLGKIEMRGEGGCRGMLRKWLSVKKSVIALTKQILFGWKLLGLEMTKTAPAGWCWGSFTGSFLYSNLNINYKKCKVIIAIPCLRKTLTSQS